VLKKLYWFLFVYDLIEPSDVLHYKKPEPFKKKLINDITLLVMFSYSLLILNPVIPIFADILAHTFWEKEHLLTVHKFHGKLHVHFELANADKQSAKDKSQGNTKSGTENFTHLIYYISYNFLSQYFIKISYRPYVFSYPINFSDCNYRPPRI